jgi:hypothetical protein
MNILIEVSYVRFQGLTASSMRMTVYWVIAPCCRVEVYRRFRGAFCIHHQGGKRALNRMRVLGFSATSVRNMFRSDRYLASYAWGVHRNAFRSLCKLFIIVFQSYRNLEYVTSSTQNLMKICSAGLDLLRVDGQSWHNNRHTLQRFQNRARWWAFEKTVMNIRVP